MSPIDTDKKEYTKEDFLRQVVQAYEAPFKVISCNNCGAFATHTHNPDKIKHHAGCQPGEAKFWGEFYGQQVYEEKEE